MHESQWLADVEQVKQLGLQRAQVVLVSAYWPAGQLPHAFWPTIKRLEEQLVQKVPDPLQVAHGLVQVIQV